MKTVTSGIGRIGSFFGVKESDQGQDGKTTSKANDSKMLSTFKDSKFRQGEQNGQQRSNGNAFSEINAPTNPEFSNLIPETEDDYKRITSNKNKWAATQGDEIRRGKKKRKMQAMQQEDNPDNPQNQYNPESGESPQKQYKKQKQQEEKQGQDEIMEYLNSEDAKKKYKQKSTFDDTLNGQIDKKTIALQKAYFGLSRAIIDGLKIDGNNKEEMAKILKLLCKEKLTATGQDGKILHQDEYAEGGSAENGDSDGDDAKPKMTNEEIDKLIQILPLKQLMEEYSPEKVKAAVKHAKKELPKFDFEKMYKEMTESFTKDRKKSDEQQAPTHPKNASLTSRINGCNPATIPAKSNIDYQLMKASSTESSGAKNIFTHRLGVKHGDIKSTESIKGRSNNHLTYDSLLTGFKEGESIPIMNCITNIDPEYRPKRREGTIQTSFRSTPEKLESNPSGPSCILDLTQCKTPKEIQNAVRTFITKYSKTGVRFVIVGQKTMSIRAALARCGVSQSVIKKHCCITKKPMDEVIRSVAKINKEENNSSQIILHSCTKEKAPQSNPLAVLKKAQEISLLRSSHITKVGKTLKEEISKASKQTKFSVNPNTTQHNPQIANGYSRQKNNEIEIQDHINKILSRDASKANTENAPNTAHTANERVSEGNKNISSNQSQNAYQSTYKNQQYSNKSAGVGLKQSSLNQSSLNHPTKNSRQNCIGVQGGKSARYQVKTPKNDESLSR